MSRHRERGGAKLKAILWTAALLAGFYVAFKVVPIYFANYQLQDKMQTEARYATVNHRSDDDLRNIIYKEAQDQDIPARRRHQNLGELPARCAHQRGLHGDRGPRGLPARATLRPHRR